ncbi:trimethylamine monooxygenase-like [Ruditapes philippinarum]|uniref:trimethylamine monooxygenase-like n=1 Tax=Ruditapes philippinarum TaxID=129788 RepID=UPI00295BAC0A|nr:trimethylamine monooxygenase-like [Ruditapes philippinarum]
MSKMRVCIIGAGPSGMSALWHFCQCDKMPEVVCFEKQSTWGGQWNRTWRTGFDEHGEPVHSCMYNDLWTNAPKESNIEFPGYTFEDHYGKSVPSYISVPVVKDYLEGRWSRDYNLRQFVQFDTPVRYVSYNDSTDTFLVTYENLISKKVINETFSHVIVCSGAFTYPFTPYIPGLDSFQGSVLHSRDLRHCHLFKDKTVLIIGSGFSAEDIAVHCLKYQASKIIVSCRTKSFISNWPICIEERPVVKRFHAKEAVFTDNTQAEIDDVILCTGFRNYYRFLDPCLRINETPVIYSKELYMSALLISAGNNKLFYVGAQKTLYTMTYFDVVANWVCRYIMGTLEHEPKSEADIIKHSKEWWVRASNVHS